MVWQRPEIFRKTLKQTWLQFKPSTLEMHASEHACFRRNGSSSEGLHVTSVRPSRKFWHLVVRSAQTISLAIWHRRQSHRRPSRNKSPNRRPFALLDLEKHTDFRIAGQHRRSVAGASVALFLIQSNLRGFRIFNEFFASLAIWGRATRIALHIAAASRDLGHQVLACKKSTRYQHYNS